jgi:hypothetical protein
VKEGGSERYSELLTITNTNSLGPLVDRQWFLSCYLLKSADFLLQTYGHVVLCALRSLMLKKFCIAVGPS